jgi:hypothetical protein
MWAALLRRHLHPARLKVKAMQTEMPKKQILAEPAGGLND